MPRFLLPAIAVVLALGFLGTYLSHRRADDLSVAHDSLTVALRDEARQRSLVDFLLTRTHAAEQRADSAEARADSLATRKQHVLIRYTAAKAVAPADCDSALALADSTIALGQAEADSLHSALQNEHTAADGYRVALDSVRATSERVGRAATAVDRASRPSLLARLTPKFGLGATAGVDPLTRRPATAIGLTLSWSF